MKHWGRGCVIRVIKHFQSFQYTLVNGRYAACVAPWHGIRTMTSPPLRETLRPVWCRLPQSWPRSTASCQQGVRRPRTPAPCTPRGDTTHTACAPSSTAPSSRSMLPARGVGWRVSWPWLVYCRELNQLFICLLGKMPTMRNTVTRLVCLRMAQHVVYCLYQCTGIQEYTEAMSWW